jgi:hypothetical protein
LELFTGHAKGLLQRISNYRVSHCDMVPSHFSCNAASWLMVHINSNSRYGRSKSYDSILNYSKLFVTHGDLVWYTHPPVAIATEW